MSTTMWRVQYRRVSQCGAIATLTEAKERAEEFYGQVVHGGSDWTPYWFQDGAGYYLHTDPTYGSYTMVRVVPTGETDD